MYTKETAEQRLEAIELGIKRLEDAIAVIEEVREQQKKEKQSLSVNLIGLHALLLETYPEATDLLILPLHKALLKAKNRLTNEEKNIYKIIKCIDVLHEK